jgi:hypothetical protein
MLSIARDVVDGVRAAPGFLLEITGLSRRRKRKRILREALQGDKAWRRLSTLAGLIGQDEQETRDLLVEIGARRSAKQRSDREMWALVSRVGKA